MFSIISGTDDKDEARRVIRENDIEIPILVDNGRKLYSDYGIRVYPTTIIIDREGTLSKDIPSHPLTYKKLLEGHIKIALGEIDEAGLREMVSGQREIKDESTLEAERLYNLAMKFTKSGLQDMAVNTAKKAIIAKPDMAEPYILLGFLKLEAGETEEAHIAFNKAVELDPNSKEAQTGLGGVLVLKGEAEKAIEVLKPATKANPYPQMAYYELAKAYELKGDKDESIKMYKKAIEKIIHKAVLPSSVAKCQ
jgi:tetratricopeptide (TPR) repeat protein